VRVNQDPRTGDGDQFQPWMDVTRDGQVNIMYFDRRDDPDNFYISTYLSRSNDGGRTFHDTRASQMVWDPSINAPTSVSGKFIGDYQGLVADDRVAIPFWNDTQLASRPPGDPGRSPYQEVFAARIPNGPAAFVDDATKPLVARRRRTVRITGIASDPGTGGAVSRVEIAARRRVKGRCLWYSARRRALVRRSCSRPVWFRATGAEKWRVSLRRRALRRGTYVLLARAVSAAGKREAEAEPLRNQRKIRVRAPRRR
jgi:hypothetical protein